MIKTKLHWWQHIHRHDVLALLLLILTGSATFAILVLPISFDQTTIPLKVGQVAPQDFQAPANAEYLSDVRTAQAREAAERAVLPIYTSPDTTISRRQISRLRTALDFITTVRGDPATPLDSKRGELNNTPDIALSPDTVDRILFVSEPRWNSTQQEAIRVLEAVMRASVREENIESIRASVPSSVSFALTEDQATIVVDLVTPFIVPNSFYSAELTEAARQKARQSVEPATQTYVAGEVVVRRGKVLNEADIEALEKLGLIRPSDPTLEYIATGAIVAVCLVFIAFYFHRRRPYYYNEGRSLVLVAILFLIFLAAVRLITPGRTVIPYIFPVPAFGLVVATLFGPGGAIILSLVLSILASFGMPNVLDLSLFYMMASLLGVLALGKAHRISAFFWSAVVSAVAGITVIIAYRLPAGNLDWIGFLTLIGASLLNGIASASLALMLQYLLAEFLGLTTALRLLEISRPDTPLLQYFLRNAPGTYQHSLMVSNLAEQAAEKLGLDTLLVRVGALYHDVGKALNASYFIENQLPDNLNPHHDITPEEAAANVIRHVTDGVQLAKKHRLPRRIIDFMLEHHGTMVARYHYNLAVRAAGGNAALVDDSKFRYPGPRPRSRETALLMLADGVEARTRSERPRTEEEMRAIVQKAIESCQKDGQLADTRFTFKDISAIIDVFVTTLTGLYHPRIRYPTPGLAQPDNSPALPAPEEQK